MLFDRDNQYVNTAFSNTSVIGCNSYRIIAGLVGGNVIVVAALDGNTIEVPLIAGEVFGNEKLLCGRNVLYRDRCAVSNLVGVSAAPIDVRDLCAINPSCCERCRACDKFIGELAVLKPKNRTEVWIGNSCYVVVQRECAIRQGKDLNDC